MRRLWLCLIVVVFAAGCAADSMEMGSTTSSTLSYGSAHIHSFDVAWATIDEMVYDPDFEGVDWNRLRDHYRPLALEAADHEDFLVVVNEMLFELGVSHSGVIPADALQMMDPILTARGWAGFDVRLIGGSV